MIVLKNTNKKVNNIIQVSDIHIRLTKRHDEYISVFDKLYDKLDKLKNNTNVICLITGDLFHNKVDLSPECVKLGSDFLKNCADRVPTILIAGNHDALLNNKNRLDSLTPIVDGLNHSNLFYLKDTEIYRYENILFNHYSVFDEPDSYINYNSIPSKYRLETDHHIALFHGPVHDAVTDIGYTVSNRAIMNDIFDGHHIAMIGDIHKCQVLQNYNEEEEKPVIVYAGSMIQQNHGEDLKGHGFILWDLNKKLFKHYELENEYGYYTIEINKGKLITDITKLPKKARIRAKCFQSIPSQTKNIINQIKEHCEIIESTFIRIEEEENSDIAKKGILDVHNISDVDYQNKLIEESLLDKKIDKDLIESVKELNKTINSQIEKDKVPNNIRWKPKTFEFHNMFSYGENNFIDFTQLKGTIGLFAPNASGKSSIMDALAFCIFDKFSKGYKAIHVLNTQKMSFSCKFNFEINGVNFFIERTGKADKKGAVKVNVKFYKIDSDGNEVPLNGEARRSTNDIIRDYVGTYEDFILTVLSVQNSKTGSFIDLGQTERKDLLCQFMGLNLFDKLHSIANENFKETNVLLKNISKNQLEDKLKEILEIVDYTKFEVEKYEKQIEELEVEKEKENNLLLELSNEVVKIDNIDIDIESLESNKINLKDDEESIEDKIKNDNSELKNLKLSLDDLNTDLEDCYDIENKFEEYRNYKTKEAKKLSEIEKFKILIKSKMDKLKKLEEHEYDPNCEYCINNVFVKDAISTKKELEDEKANANKIVGEYNDLKQKVESYGEIEKRYKSCQKIQTKKSNIESKIHEVNSKLLKYENSLIKIKNDLKVVDKDISSFYKNKDIIENNRNLLNDIKIKKNTIKDLELKIKDNNSKLYNVSNQAGKLDGEIKSINQQIDKVKELEESYESYKLYTSLVNRDGIPYDVIKRILPEIEKEVNNILSHIVEFTVGLTTDGKNIMTNIIYDDRTWPLEMASGMEKFISGLAIRVSLINISNLPRPNIICIDEGFGCADSDHLGQMGSLFTYLKHQFEFIWVISHLDQMRDMVDEKLEIKKDNGFSKINHS